MENTLENKAKFMALYLGQKVMFHEIRNNLELPLLSVKHYTKRVAKWKLELKPLSAISDEDALEVFKIKSPLTFMSPVKKKWNVRRNPHYITVESGKSVHKLTMDLVDGEVLFYNDDELEVTAGGITIDLLRSKGYAVPFLDLSVESQISYGWVKLAEVC